MDRRPADGAPALWRRVRWANVGRLAVLLAAVFLIVPGGRGCRSSSPPPLPAPVGPLRAERPQWPTTGLPEGRLTKPRKGTVSSPSSRKGKTEGELPRPKRMRPRPRRARGSGEAFAPEQRLAAPAAPVEPIEPVKPVEPLVPPGPPAPPSTPSGPATPPPSAGSGEFTPDPGE